MKIQHLPMYGVNGKMGIILKRKGGVLMKEIKFRAYHKHLNKMFYNITVTKDGWLSEDNHFGGTLNEVMQYIGIKDIQKISIYEEDLLELVIIGTEGKKTTVRVFYDKIECCYGIEYICTDFEKNFKGYLRDIKKLCGDNVKVIGNLYEKGS